MEVKDRQVALQAIVEETYRQVFARAVETGAIDPNHVLIYSVRVESLPVIEAVYGNSVFFEMKVEHFFSSERLIKNGAKANLATIVSNVVLNKFEGQGMSMRSLLDDHSLEFMSRLPKLGLAGLSACLILMERHGLLAGRGKEWRELPNYRW